MIGVGIGTLVAGIVLGGFVTDSNPYVYLQVQW